MQIRTIPARKLPQFKNMFKNVAAYARVSSGKDAMLHSLAAQVSYYSGLIQKTPGWTYAGVYADEAKTGTKSDRPEFQRLLADCRVGKVDMIITKSISRFARNTLTTLETVRALRELLLTLLAVYAQEESRSTSENCKWRIYDKFKAGELATLRHLYGYRITKGVVEPDPESAPIVQMIFSDYLAGMGLRRIANKLREMGIPTHYNGEWTDARVAAVLKNEKYTGNALLQKTYIADHLTKKQVPNVGAVDQFFVEGTHTAIIDAETFETARQLLAQRRPRQTGEAHPRKRHAFTGMLLCPHCGKNFTRQTAHGRASWNCSTLIKKGKAACRGKQIPEETLWDTAAAALSMDSFCEDSFREQIAKVIVPQDNHLLFVFHDGREVARVWQDRSRRESWTAAMRQSARERQLGQTKRRAV